MILSTATANPVLTATLQKFILDLNTLVGLKIAPIFLTSQQSAKYYVFDKDNTVSIPTDIGRAPSSAYKRTLMKLSDDSYSASNKGIEIPVDDEERAKYATAFAADEAAIQRATNIIMLNHEIRIANLVLNNSNNTTVGTKWDAYDNDDSNPIADIDAAKEVIHVATGLEANLLVLPRTVFNALKEHPLLIERIKYSQKGILTTDLLAELFGIDQIIIAGSIQNSAADGQTVSNAYIWGDNVFLGHVENSADLAAPNFARTFVWTAQTSPSGVLVESYREDKVQSDIHRAKQYTDEKVVGSELGYTLKDCLT